MRQVEIVGGPHDGKTIPVDDDVDTVCFPVPDGPVFWRPDAAVLDTPTTFHTLSVPVHWTPLGHRAYWADGVRR